MDIQRNIDRENIDDIIKTLRKCRKRAEEPQSSSKPKQTPKKKAPAKSATPLRGKKPPTTSTTVKRK